MKQIPHDHYVALKSWNGTPAKIRELPTLDRLKTTKSAPNELDCQTRPRGVTLIDMQLYEAIVIELFTFDMFKLSYFFC